jgi:hypothetical protein
VEIAVLSFNRASSNRNPIVPDSYLSIRRSDEEQHRVPRASRVMGDLSGKTRDDYGSNYHE